MDPQPDQPGAEAPAVGIPDLLEVCRILNEAGVQYLVYGGLACLLHGHERMTKDADISVADTDENLDRTLQALRNWGAGYARELTVCDLRENVVVRICDKFILDVAVRLWRLDWHDAWRNRRIITIQNVEIPLLCRADLIQSKQTYREQDHWDVRVLSSLVLPEPGRAAVS